MKNIILLSIFILFSGQAFAERVCLEKSTGRIITYQTGSVNDPIDTSGVKEKDKKEFIKDIKFVRMNALRGYCLSEGYNEGDFECKDISIEEFGNLMKTAEEKKKQSKRIEGQQKEEKRKLQEDKIKQKLGLSDDDFEALREAIR